MYALVTPVRDEEALIEGVIHAVLRQTVRPAHWVIVSDNSRDRTAQIVASYAARYNFIRLVRLDDGEPRDFASKIRAFDRGYEALRPEPFDFIGNLDGDVTFAPTYYEKALAEFARDPALGIVGGVIMENIRGEFKKQRSSADHTPGATQLFRRPFFETIGGYPLLKGGGEDSAADIMIRMHGWKTRSFEHLLVFHHRRVGAGLGGVLRARYGAGTTDYHLGKHPLFMAAKVVVRLPESPFVLGSCCRLAGYLGACLKGEERAVSEEFIRFIRREQMRKISIFKLSQ